MRYSADLSTIFAVSEAIGDVSSKAPRNSLPKGGRSSAALPWGR